MNGCLCLLKEQKRIFSHMKTREEEDDDDEFGLCAPARSIKVKVRKRRRDRARRELVLVYCAFPWRRETVHQPRILARLDAAISAGWMHACKCVKRGCFLPIKPKVLYKHSLSVKYFAPQPNANYLYRDKRRPFVVLFCANLSENPIFCLVNC